MTITKTLLLAGLTVASLAGPAMAQEGPDLGQLYWAEKALQAAPAAAPVQVLGLSHSFFSRSNALGTADVPSVGGGEGQ